MKSRYIVILSYKFIPIKNQTNKMKKVLALLTAFVFVGLVACGPSAEDAKKIEEALQAAADSAANALLQQASDAATEPAPADSVAADTAHSPH